MSPPDDDLLCDWCGGRGRVIGIDYPPVHVAKCDDCHHEWSVVRRDPEEI